MDINKVKDHLKRNRKSYAIAAGAFALGTGFGVLISPWKVKVQPIVNPIPVPFIIG